MCFREKCADKWSAVKFGVKKILCPQQINTPPPPWVPLPLQLFSCLQMFVPARQVGMWGGQP